MNYRKWLIEDLQRLESDRFALSHIAAELETVKAEHAAIKATNYDQMPSGSGTNTQEEKMLTALAKKDELEANLEATRRRVESMDALLAALPADERRVIERMYIAKESHATERLSEELGYEIAQIYRIKNKALTNLAQLRHGAGYQT